MSCTIDKSHVMSENVVQINNNETKNSISTRVETESVTPTHVETENLIPTYVETEDLTPTHVKTSAHDAIQFTRSNNEDKNKDIENIEEKELSQNKRDVNNNKINDEITVNRSNSEYNSETSSPQTQSSLTAENSNFLSPASTTDNLLTVKVEDSEFSTFEVFKTVKDVIHLPARMIIS